METKHALISFAPYISIVLLRYKSRWGDIKIIESVTMFRENRVKKLTVAEEKSFILALRLSGHSIDQISRQIDCSCNI